MQTSSILQPIMRFTPRTDLERVYDSIIKNNFTRKIDKTIIEKQLKDLEFNFSKNLNMPNEDEEIDEFDLNNTSRKDFKKRKNSYDEKKPKIQNKNEILNKNKKPPTKKFKKRVINNEAKNLMKDFHLKTHFKGASVIAYQPSKNKFLII